MKSIAGIYTPLQYHYFLIFTAHCHLTSIAAAHTHPTLEHEVHWKHLHNFALPVFLT